jgi:hypothetical protein
MDRPALNLDDLRRLVLGLTERGVNIVFVKENLTFAGEDSPMSGAFAEFELEGPRCSGKVEHLLIDILMIGALRGDCGRRELGRHGALWSEQGGLAVDFPEATERHSGP